MTDTGYVAELAAELYQRYPDLLTAENDLTVLRALAQALTLPDPAPEKTHG